MVYSLLQHWDLTGQSNLKEEYYLFFSFLKREGENSQLGGGVGEGQRGEIKT